MMRIHQKMFGAKLENRENFHDFKFFSQNFAKSHKIRKENARFFTKYSRIQQKNARGNPQNCLRSRIRSRNTKIN